mmetsp:Transcript_37376/g.90194  ORF Transcript_37376/g.90194 Transcript_37376/m.90194 type:complete len:247 (+) Transcript_37376:1902-2642(+)
MRQPAPTPAYPPTARTPRPSRTDNNPAPPRTFSSGGGREFRHPRKDNPLRASRHHRHHRDGGGGRCSTDFPPPRTSRDGVRISAPSSFPPPPSSHFRHLHHTSIPSGKGNLRRHTRHHHHPGRGRNCNIRETRDVSPSRIPTRIARRGEGPCRTFVGRASSCTAAEATTTMKLRRCRCRRSFCGKESNIAARGRRRGRNPERHHRPPSPPPPLVASHHPSADRPCPASIAGDRTADDTHYRACRAR